MCLHLQGKFYLPLVGRQLTFCEQCNSRQHMSTPGLHGLLNKPRNGHMYRTLIVVANEDIRLRCKIYVISFEQFFFIKSTDHIEMILCKESVTSLIGLYKNNGTVPCVGIYLYWIWLLYPARTQLVVTNFIKGPINPY